MAYHFFWTIPSIITTPHFPLWAHGNWISLCCSHLFFQLFSQGAFGYVLPIISFILAWIETWFLDFKVLPQESEEENSKFLSALASWDWLGAELEGSAMGAGIWMERQVAEVSILWCLCSLVGVADITRRVRWKGSDRMWLLPPAVRPGFLRRCVTLVTKTFKQQKSPTPLSQTGWPFCSVNTQDRRHFVQNYCLRTEKCEVMLGELSQPF